MAQNDMLLGWAVELQSLAQAGLAYCKDAYDKERYELTVNPVSSRTSFSVFDATD